MALVEPKDDDIAKIDDFIAFVKQTQQLAASRGLIEEILNEILKEQDESA